MKLTEYEKYTTYIYEDLECSVLITKLYGFLDTDEIKIRHPQAKCVTYTNHGSILSLDLDLTNAQGLIAIKSY
jgi:hypothetical protein